MQPMAQPCVLAVIKRVSGGSALQDGVINAVCGLTIAATLTATSAAQAPAAAPGAPRKRMG